MTKKVISLIGLTALLVSQSAFAVTLKDDKGRAVADVTCENQRAEAVVAANLENKAVLKIEIYADLARIYYSDNTGSSISTFPLNKASTCKVSAQILSE